MTSISLGIYQHYKGMLVEVIGVASHSETMEQLVVYSHKDPVKGKEASSLWVRPLKMFFENIIVNGKEMPRFKFVKSIENFE